MQIYLSAPITGVQNYEAHFDRLKELVKAGLPNHFNYEPLSPIELPEPEVKIHTEYMRQDIRALMDCKAIVMGLGWQESRGCLSEFLSALSAGLEIYFEQPASHNTTKIIHVGKQSYSPIY